LKEDPEGDADGELAKAMEENDEVMYVCGLLAEWCLQLMKQREPERARHACQDRAAQ
jgi:hypothetical protein